ncbi:hypothetical protein C8R44DRAFT_372021 [Mycena epipterygia]|nr:hypothetical protein C8R44DRAFT_372021 [Mycena epipterygia]
MLSESTSTTKRRNTKATSPPDVDHRKRRRNRTTQSCLNCHTTKRMCDRKRPCSRCTQLGLTGLCVYEVEDPARQSDAQDDNARLLDRIAELEGVVRELKNKPNPRWVDARDVAMQSSPGTSASALKSPPYLETTLPGPSSFGDLAWSDLFNWDSSPPSDSSYRHSPVSTPSPLVPASRPPEPFPFGSPCRGSRWTENMVQIPRKCDTSCSCMSEPACYNSALELASELRRAATVLSRSLNHCYEYPCTLRTKICELESLTMNALRTARVCPDALDVSGAPVRLHGEYRPVTIGRSGEQQGKIVRGNPFWDESGLPAYDNSFMSWISPTMQKQF